jgi:hypothetical protein
MTQNILIEKRDIKWKREIEQKIKKIRGRSES